MWFSVFFPRHILHGRMLSVSWGPNCQIMVAKTCYFGSRWYRAGGGFPSRKKQILPQAAQRPFASSQHPGLCCGASFSGWGWPPSPVLHRLPESLPVSEEGLVSEPGLWLWALGWRKPPGLASTPAPPKAACSTTRRAFPPGVLSKRLPANTSRPASTGIPNRDKSGAPGGSAGWNWSVGEIYHC